MLQFYQRYCITNLIKFRWFHFWLFLIQLMLLLVEHSHQYKYYVVVNKLAV
jgi:hypothetical protein